MNGNLFIFDAMLELTPQLLNLYQDCPRCLWSRMNEKSRRPVYDIFSQVNGHMRRAFNKYGDLFRSGLHLPSELQSQIQGSFLPDQDRVDRFRSPKTALKFESATLGVRLLGILDECIVREENGETLYSPLEFAIRGIDSGESNHDQHAQMRLDCYDFLLHENGMKTSGTGYVVYYTPEEVQEMGNVRFHVQVFQFVSDSERVKNLLSRVVRDVNNETPPNKLDCEFCDWGDIST